MWVGFDQPKTIVPNGYAADLAVPIWGAFMKVATKGDKADWFDRPANVVGVNVCRISGKLPNTGCGNVINVNDDGSFETRSMIYTDYFVKGTQPTTLCPVHVMGGYAAGISADAQPSMPQSAANGEMRPPAAPVGTAGAAPPISGGTVTPPQDPQKKKRGFWGKIFGKGGGG